MPLEIRETSKTSEVKYGHTAVGTSAVQLTTDGHKFLRGIIIKADTNNTGVIFVGTTSGVTANTNSETGGFPLSAGDAFEVPAEDPSNIHLISDTASQDVAWMGV